MSQTLSTDEIMNIAKLARLGVNAEQADSYANDLSKILSMMDILAEVNTDNIAPLTNVHDMTQPCLLYTSPSPRDQRGSRMPSSA